MRLATIKINNSERLVAYIDDKKLLDLELASQANNKPHNFFSDMHSMIE